MAAILIGRDAVLALTLLIYRRRGLPPPRRDVPRKGATFLLMFALPMTLAAHGDWSIATVAQPLGAALLIWGGTVLYVWTGLLYTVNALTVARTVPVRGPGGEEREVH